MESLFSGLAASCPEVTKIQWIYEHLHYVCWSELGRFPLPRRHHSPSYSTICVINGDSSHPRSLPLCLLSCLLWNSWEVHNFLCVDAPGASTLAHRVSPSSPEITLDYTSSLPVLATKEPSPSVRICLHSCAPSPPMSSATVSTAPWYRAAKQLWQRAHVPHGICQKSFQNISVTPWC